MALRGAAAVRQPCRRQRRLPADHRLDRGRLLPAARAVRGPARRASPAVEPGVRLEGEAARSRAGAIGAARTAEPRAAARDRRHRPGAAGRQADPREPRRAQGAARRHRARPADARPRQGRRRPARAARPAGELAARAHLLGLRRGADRVVPRRCAPRQQHGPVAQRPQLLRHRQRHARRADVDVRPDLADARRTRTVDREGVRAARPLRPQGRRSQRRGDERHRRRQRQPARRTADLQGQLAAVRAEAKRLDRYRALLRGWRLVHVPCSVLLLALVAVHVLSIYYY